MTSRGAPRIGLLPLMLDMYRKYAPELERSQELFVSRVSDKLSDISEVSRSKICTTREDVESALATFSGDAVDALVILYTAYAPSITALNPLLRSDLPLILFSTAPRASMAEGITMKDIMENHGIHGYMDLANVLKRNDRPYVFVGGSIESEKPWAYIAAFVRAAHVKSIVEHTRIGIAGHAFDGMGDLAADTTRLNARLGVEVEHLPLAVIARHVGSVAEEAVQEECTRDRERFVIEEGVEEELLHESNRLYLGLAGAIEERSIDAFTMHFQAILDNSDIHTPPFLAISKLQERGIAYAGEGDVLGAMANLMLRHLCGESLFTEPFCPDFSGGRLLMGHMGESNPRFGKKTTLRRKEFQFGDAIAPVVTDVEMEPSEATLLNLALVEDSMLQMIAVTGEITEKIPGNRDIDMPYFHYRPRMAMEEFLAAYGYAGGTHHMAMARGDRVADIQRLADFLDIRVTVL